MKLVFATGNRGKLAEAAEILGSGYDLLTPRDLGLTEDIPETGLTLRENSIQKARYIYDRLGCDCFADDTGLEVDALDGAPGVFSARYAGPECDFKANVAKLLRELDGWLISMKESGALEQVIDKWTNGPEDEKTVRGTPFLPAGVAVNRIVELKKSEWENTYRKGDNVAAMHIPFGGGLTPERAFKSFSAVQPFFSKHYPELPFRMIQCVSWIMGKHLEHILPPEANLLNLQHNLYMMPHPSNLYGGLSFLFPKLDEVNPN